MTNNIVYGLDIAKTIFQVYGQHTEGRCVSDKRLSRKQLLDYFSRQERGIVGIEACMTAHYWSRELTKLGYQVKLIAPEKVAAYRQGQKNDRNDAMAICEAIQRPNMRFVAVKTAEQQAVLAIHKARSLVIKQRVELSNSMRALLLEFGFALPCGVNVLVSRLNGILEDADNDLPSLVRSLLDSMKERLLDLEVQKKAYEHQLSSWHKQNEMSQRLATIPGVGLLNATALVSTIGDIRTFKNARSLSAYLGLVAKQHSSGEKQRLMGITKRGNAYVRSLLVHGARSVIRQCKLKMERGVETGQPWLEACLQRMHVNKACVALANKMARTAWALWNHGEDYRAPAMI